MSNKISQASLTFGAAFAVHELNLSTGTGARAISGIHRHLGLTSDELPGKEGSFGEYEGLEPGIYEIGFWLETQEREPNSRDILYVYNKRSSPILIGDTIAAMGNLTGLYEKLQHTTIEIEVPYGYLALVLVDETSKNEFEFQEKFSKIIGEAGLITLKVFNYNFNPANSTNLSQEQYAFQMIFDLYKLAAKIGQFNNTENALLSNYIPKAFNLIRDYLSQLNSLNALPGVIRVFELMRDDAYIPLAFADNYNLIESLWIESWGLN